MCMQAMNRFVWISVMLFVVAMTSQQCYYDNAEELYPQTEDPNDSIVTFADDIQPMITTYCSNTAACHAAGAPGGATQPVLVTYADISSSIVRIEQRVIVDGNMPPSGQAEPTPEEIQELQTWIDEGFPDN